VCQDGANSYFDKHGVPCDLVVDNQDYYSTITWDDGVVRTSRGVSGVCGLGGYGGWCGEHGDSGGLVFSVNGSARQARGIYSQTGDSGIFGSTNDWCFWTEAPDILGSFGMVLNPHQ
jgi:hypothetical protein